MMDINDIFSAYAEELKAVEKQLIGIFKSDVLIIPKIGQYIIQGGGKRIRPLFLLISADLCGYKEKKRFLLSAIIEAIHTASLLHDDVIDRAETRRGKPTAHSIWGNQVVVLTGDFLYSNALKLAVAQKNQKIMEALSEATTKMTEGEILQLHKTGDPDISKDEYFEIISAKTGILISAACRTAAILAEQPEEKESALARFGLKTGIAFQLADDVLDYVAEQRDLGKRLGKDLEEGKITMPIISLLRSASDKERDEIKNIISECSNLKSQILNSRSGLGRILEMFSKYNAIEDSLLIARSLIEEAKAELDMFPSSREKSSLLAMADYAMQRKK